MLWNLNLGKCLAEVSGLPTDEYSSMYMKILCQCIFIPCVKLKLRMVKKKKKKIIIKGVKCPREHQTQLRIKRIDKAGH